jgi:hypothetical protein
VIYAREPALGLTIPETLLATADEVISETTNIHRGARKRGGVAGGRAGASRQCP